MPLADDFKRMYQGGGNIEFEEFIFNSVTVWKIGTVKKSLLFTSSGNFTVPAETKSLKATVIGGGGGGGFGHIAGSAWASGGAGAGGGKVVAEFGTSLNGQTIAAVVGALGTQAAAAYGNGSAGGNSGFASAIAYGGPGGLWAGTGTVAGGTGEGGTVTPGGNGEVGKVAAATIGGHGHVINGVEFGRGSGGYILGNGNPSPGTGGAIFIEWEEYE